MAENALDIDMILALIEKKDRKMMHGDFFNNLFCVCNIINI